MKLKKIVLWILLGLCISACSAALPIFLGSTATPAPSSTPTLTLTPTATPTPLPTPTPQPAMRVEAGDLNIRLGDYDKAMEEFQTVLNTSQDGNIVQNAWLGIGQVHYLTGDYAAALDAFRTTIDQFPDSPQKGLAYFHLGQTYSALDRNAEAAEAYSMYLSTRPGMLDSFVLELRGDALSADGNYTEANTAYQAAQSASRLGPVEGMGVKIAQNLASQGDYQAAIDQFTAVYNSTSNEDTKATADLLIGQAYLNLENPEEAYKYFLDAVNNYPSSINSYYALVALVDAGIPVDDLNRGLVDYFAGQYTPAIEAFDRSLQSNPNSDGTPLYYKGLALGALGQHETAIEVWNSLIANYPTDRFWTSAWDEIIYTQWVTLGEYGEAAQTGINFVSTAPDNPQAADFLYQAARNLERAGNLDEAALVWERVAEEYASSDQSFRSLLLAGICRYRQSKWEEAKTTFQRALLLASAPEDQAAAYLWVGKTQWIGNDAENAHLSWQQAAAKDPTGYYSERARDLFLDRSPFSLPGAYDLAFDMEAERVEAENWLRTTFNIPPETNMLDLGLLNSDPRMIRGLEYWKLGMWSEARDEFEALREEVSTDPLQTYRLVNHFYQLGIYRSAILASRQVLTLAGMDDAATLTAPSYFNHIRFGPYYKDLLLPAAESEGLHPLLLFSVVRQESLFEGFARSSAGARGLMQVIPSTGESVAANLGWPQDFTPQDLYRPVVSVRLGSHYLAQQREYFDGDLYSALAAYNGGPGNSIAWQELASGDPDLMLEVIRIQETRQYIMRIYEIFNIYRRLYERTP